MINDDDLVALAKKHGWHRLTLLDALLARGHDRPVAEALADHAFELAEALGEGMVINCDDCEDVADLEGLVNLILNNEARIGRELYGLVALFSDTPYAEVMAEITGRIARIIRENVEASGINVNEDEEDDQ